MEFPKRKEDLYRSCGFKTTMGDIYKDLFHTIYFVDYNTGSLLLSSNFRGSNIQKTDEDLIGSFLNAINLFINEIRENQNIDDEIQEINFKDSRILYERKDKVMIIGISKKKNLPLERDILKMILQDFYTRFEPKLNNFKGFIDKDILNYKNLLKNLSPHDFIGIDE
jgi:hypothetical protein